MRTVVLAIVLAACGPRPAAEPPSNARASGGEIVLYRDGALVQQRVVVDIPARGIGTARVEVAAGARDIVVVERDRYTIKELHVPEDPPPRVAPSDDQVAIEPPPVTVKEVELVVEATPGRHALHLAYTTDRVLWDAAYTMTTTPARDSATIRGALAIHNAMGIALPAVTVRVVDAELEPSSRRAAEQLSASYQGAGAAPPLAEPRDLGRIDVVDGETRVELLTDSRPRPLRAVLVYDPVGTDLDRASAAPVIDQALGATITQARVTESFEVARDAAATRGLPSGPVRLLERRGDGTIAVIGESRMFDAATRVAETDTVSVGTAVGVTGRRERREYTLDKTRKRLTEEFVLAIDNARSVPVEVIVREHLYRGQNWTLAYRSSPVAAKEGPQQISMRMIVPAKGQGQLLYVVVYTWQ